MAITFLEKRKRLQYLFPALGIILLITGIILWQGFFAKKEELEFIPPPPTPAKKIEIDFKTLKSPQLEELQPFEKVPPYEGEVGRENPFLPY